MVNPSRLEDQGEHFMPSSEFIFENIIHLGAVLYLVCFLFRDQVWLRIFAFLGDGVYCAYYWGITDQPLWSAITYSALNMFINLVMVMGILNDRRETTLGDNDMKLYQGFAGMTPGDFRRLSRIGTWKTADQDITLTEEGRPLAELHYVLEGDVEISKSGRPIPVSAGIFIGEIAYLKQAVASATVKLKSGAVYMSWPHEALLKATAKHDGLKQSLAHLLSTDMATKIARS